MSNVNEVVFCARKPNPTDGHWYANFGYYAHDPERKGWQEGTYLGVLNLKTKAVRNILEDAHGGVRDPQLNYDGRKVLFSYRKGGTENYLLHEIDLDGSGLRQITTGIYDDIEPSYLPDGNIVFVSSRCKRWVNCWLTQVATLHRCGPNGENIRPLSSNNEQDNTPWPMPDGRVLYTRWEYVDRSQVDYHHLWVANPDGTAQMIWYGNLHPGILMIDAKPIPGSDKVISIFSPGHGQREHAGAMTVVDPKAGPDAKDFAKQLSKRNQYRDPWAFSENAFMAADGPAIVLMDETGRVEEIYRLPASEGKADMILHEPRPVAAREREPVIIDRVQASSPTGKLVLADINDGRAMHGVKQGEIKRLLVLESLPMPIHYTGGMDPISYGGTFTLERVVGTVPVEPDGSAYMELPALRSFFFVALDENDLSVKRMQSFLTVQPGEVTSCVGCHEQRTRTPSEQIPLTTLAAVRRAPSKVEPVADTPDVFDFPRHIQPILDRLCVDCHGYEKTPRGGPQAGKLVLTGDHGPMFSHSYYMLTISGLFSDGRNQPRSSYAPRQLGSSATRLLKFMDGSHYEAKATEREMKWVRLWVESGAAYPGTYAALGTGMIGSYQENNLINTDFEWPTTRAGADVMKRRCAECHGTPQRVLPLALADERGMSFWRPDMQDPRLVLSRHAVFNLSRPELSSILLAPLAKSAGGWASCGNVFLSRDDADYKALLALCAAGKDYLEKNKRFDMPGFAPRIDWVREMQRYGILAKDADSATLDVYEVERHYWESLWFPGGVLAGAAESAHR